jgi:hypothetical protein
MTAFFLTHETLPAHPFTLVHAFVMGAALGAAVVGGVRFRF